MTSQCIYYEPEGLGVCSPAWGCNPQCYSSPCVIKDDPLPGISGVPYGHRDTFAQVLNISLPVIGALSLLKMALPNGWARIKNSIHRIKSSFREAQVKQVGKIVLKAACVTAAVAVPATLLAASIGPPIATATGCGALYLISRSSELKEKVKTLFRRLPDETPENARSRIRKNIRNAILGTCVFSGLVGTAAYFLSDVFQSNTYSITLRSQTDAVVFAEYGVLALGHLAFAKGRYQNKQKIAAIYYFLNALISVGFPIAYFKTYDHNGPLRLHHSWIGQALQLLPGVNSKILGAALSLDSLNYIATTPGYTEFQMDSAGTICQVYSPYGLDNIVVENFEAVMKSISIGCGLEFLGFLLKDRAPTIEPDSHPSVRNLPEIENSQPSPTPSQYDSIPSPVDSGIV